MASYCLLVKQWLVFQGEKGVRTAGYYIRFVKSHNSDLVYVEGALRYADYVDKEGIGRTKAEITQSKWCVYAYTINAYFL